MALIERLMRWGKFPGETTGAEPESRWLQVHDFYAASMEMAAGRLTVQQFKNAIESTPEDDADIDSLVASIPSLAGTRAIRIHEMHAIFLLAEERYGGGYDTPSDVRTKLGL
jgi:hypothetical protein